LGIVGIYETTAGIVAAGYADQNLVTYDEGGRGGAEIVFNPAQAHIPTRPAGLRIQGDQMSVESSHEERSIQNCQPAIDRPTTKDQLFRQTPFVVPKFGAGASVNRESVIPGSTQVNDTIHK